LQELYFAVDNFITVGSPIGLFCALRGVNPHASRPLGSPAAGRLYPGSAPGGLPVCTRFYNVFHPLDPVAYRMEPLIVGPHAPAPQLVPYMASKSGTKTHVYLSQAGGDVASAVGGAVGTVTMMFARKRSEEHDQARRQTCSFLRSAPWACRAACQGRPHRQSHEAAMPPGADIKLRSPLPLCWLHSSFSCLAGNRRV
jgi:DDHD domain